jgi:hypothetical protein
MVALAGVSKQVLAGSSVALEDSQVPLVFKPSFIHAALVRATPVKGLYFS